MSGKFINTPAITTVTATTLTIFPKFINHSSAGSSRSPGSPQ